MRRTVVGTIAALAAMAALTAIMLPVRSHLSIATSALVLVVPVVIGVVVGGFLAGVTAVAVGFLVYDFFFIPPYHTFSVGAPENWAALAVYLAVMLPVARVVGGLHAARAETRRQGKELKELFQLSDLLVEDQPLDVLLSTIVTSLAEVFDSSQVAILLPNDKSLDVVASAGDQLNGEQLVRIGSQLGTPSPGPDAEDSQGDLLLLDLTAAGRPVGVLAISGEAAQRSGHEALLLFGNQIALAVERSQLREAALSARVTEEMARLAKTLVAAVSHDLRAPLALIKASSSTLADPDIEIESDAAHRLAALIDSQSDKLAELVRNLLDSHAVHLMI